jgi:Flp pilus assembly pilin Flp
MYLQPNQAPQSHDDAKEVRQMNLFVLKTWLDTKFRTDEDGASLVEYILLVALIALAVIAASSSCATRCLTSSARLGSKLSTNGS